MTLNYGHYGRDLLLELARCRDVTVAAAATSLVPAYNDVLVANAVQDLRLHVQALHDQHQAVLHMNKNASAAAAATAAATATPGSHKPSMAVRPSILLQTAAIQRNKQCLLAYHVERVKRFCHLYWKGCDLNRQNSSSSSSSSNYNSSSSGGGETIPSERAAMNTLSSSSSSSSPLFQAMCPAERDFLSQYSDLVARYAQACHLEPDDLRAYGGHPPLSATDRVQVRVIRMAKKEKADRTNDDNDNDEDENGPIVLESGTVVQFTPGSTHYLLWTDVEEYVRKGMLVVLEGEEEA